jgi:hypothetical protein
MVNKTEKKWNAQSIQKALLEFHGTTAYYRYSLLFPNFVLTDGTRFVATACEAFWLMDAIASHQGNPVLQRTPRLRQLQFWTLTVTDESGILVCQEDSDQKPAIRQDIPYTDFPLASIQIWVAPTELPDGSRMLIAYLPQEH